MALREVVTGCWGGRLLLVASIGACAGTTEGLPAKGTPDPSPAGVPAPPVFVEIEGERLADVAAAAFAADRDALWVRREDGSREVWALDGALLRHYSAADWARERAVDGPIAIEPTAPARGAVRLPTAPGMDDARLIAWAKGLGCEVEEAVGELVIGCTAGATPSASPDGQIVVIEKDGDAHVAHRETHAHFRVSGWNRGFSSHYGYAGDITTWAGSVEPVFGPARDQLVLLSVAQRSVSFAYGAGRLYDPRTGRSIASLVEETCQPNQVFFSPLGKHIVRERCGSSGLLVSDGASGSPGPELPADSFLAFKGDESAIAGGFRGSARVFAPTDPEPRYVVPGPSPAVLDVELVHGDLGIAILRADGLDLWDLRKGMLEQHVGSVPRGWESAPLERSGTGRFVALGVEGRGAAAVTAVVDTETGLVSQEAALVALDPTRDAMARADGRRLVWIDLPARASLPGVSAVVPSALQSIAFAPSGVLVAELRDCSVWAFDAPGRPRFKTTPLDRRGCQSMDILGDRVRVSGESGTHEVALRDGARLQASDGPTELDAWLERPRPAFSPPAFEESLHAKDVRRPRWRSRAGLFVGGMEVPVVTREKDRRSIWLHAFPYGRGRAAIVVDDRGRWDSNDVGAALVRVRRGTRVDETEKETRHIPGLLAAFCRGE